MNTQRPTHTQPIMQPTNEASKEGTHTSQPAAAPTHTMEQGGAAPRVVLRGELYKASQHLSGRWARSSIFAGSSSSPMAPSSGRTRRACPQRMPSHSLMPSLSWSHLRRSRAADRLIFRITPINRTINPQQTYRFAPPPRRSAGCGLSAWMQGATLRHLHSQPAVLGGQCWCRRRRRSSALVSISSPNHGRRASWSTRPSTTQHSRGLLVGDTIVAVDGTVVRTLQLAQKAFGRAPPSGQVLLRLAGWNREVRLIKQAGISGITLSATPDGFVGVLVSAVTRDSAAAAAGLHVGDRVLAVNGTRCAKAMQVDGTPLEAHEMASALIRASLQEVKVVVSGSSIQVDIRKDADGRLGVGFAHGPPPRGLMGAVITDVMPRGPAHSAGLRNGDLLVSVDGKLVSNQRNGITLLSAAARALTCVVWRPRPQEDSDEKASLASSKASSATASGSTHNRDPQAASGAGAVVAVGMVPYAYYVHGIDRSMRRSCL